MTRIKKDLIVFFILVLFSPLLFYNLGGFGLADFDEGWYAGISANILKTGQPLVLAFNGETYTDHPPLGFIITAISFAIFGQNEFAARLPQALAGLGSLIVLYLIGKNIFNRAIGLGASLILVSTVWFVLRARTGDLDSLFLFFYLLCAYGAIKAARSQKWLIPFGILGALLLSVKSLIGISIVAVSLVFITRSYIKSKLFPTRQIILSLLAFLAIILAWFLPNLALKGSYYINHMIDIGLKNQSRMKPNFSDIFASLTFQYLHFGIRKWFYPAIISLIGALIFLRKFPVLIYIYSIIFILLLGFLTNAKTEIWHIIPLYPFLSLLISFFLYHSLSFVLKVIRTGKNASLWAGCTTCILIAAVCVFQIYKFKDEINLFTKSKSGLVITAQAARGKPEELFLDNTYFLPGTVFYSGKNVKSVQSESPPRNLVKGLVEGSNNPILILTEQYRLDTDKVDTKKYNVIAKSEGNVLIITNP